MIKQPLKLLLFSIAAALLCFAFFAKYGFNFMDEGFILSISNRLLHGQIPHVDFTSLRPVGSPFFHIAELLISKKYAFLLSRLVFWLQESIIVYCWILILQKQFFEEITMSENWKYIQYFFFVFIFILNVNYFPNFALHTIDGLFFSVIGFYILFNHPKASFAGFLLLGYAALCKQGYAALLPLAMILFSARFRLFPLLFIPAAVYCLHIFIHNGWHDFSLQMSSHGELFKVGVLNYLKRYPFYIGIIFTLVLHYKVKTLSETYKSFFITLFLLVAVICFLQPLYLTKFSFFLFGCVLCLTVIQKKHRSIQLTAIALAWCVSISLGFAYPILCTGILLSIIWIQYLPQKKWIFLQGILAILFIVIFYYARLNFHYLDKGKKELTYSLTNIIEGAAGIYTSKNIYDVASEIKQLRVQYKNISMQPDFCSSQILNSHNNPVKTEWANPTELSSNYLLNRVVEDFKKDTSIYFAVSRYQTSAIAEKFIEYDSISGYHNRLLDYIKTNYKPIRKTAFFIIYH